MMLERWFRRMRRPRPAPLQGAPAIHRTKTYSAASGYVYQYRYQGFREAGEAIEYVFEVSADRRTVFPTTVILPLPVLRDWEAAHHFTLRDNEKHGIAKIALFQAFDDRPDPASLRAPIQIRRADLEAIVETLGLL